MTKAKALGITKFPYYEYDSNGMLSYYESENGYWSKKEYDSNNCLTYYDDYTGYWAKWEYDSNGNETHYENSDGKMETFAQGK